MGIQVLEGERPLTQQLELTNKVLHVFRVSLVSVWGAACLRLAETLKHFVLPGLLDLLGFCLGFSGMKVRNPLKPKLGFKGLRFPGFAVRVENPPPPGDAAHSRPDAGASIPEVCCT